MNKIYNQLSLKQKKIILAFILYWIQFNKKYLFKVIYMSKEKSFSYLLIKTNKNTQHAQNISKQKKSLRERDLI